jgi:hypothetical protein
MSPAEAMAGRTFCPFGDAAALPSWADQEIFDKIGSMTPWQNHDRGRLSGTATACHS